jgi:hypothetical protein
LNVSGWSSPNVSAASGCSAASSSALAASASVCDQRPAAVLAGAISPRRTMVT